MKTLIIHPKDHSTTFLSEIYKGMKNITLVTGGDITPSELKEMIPNFDRVMIMGHGTPYGLLNTGAFSKCRGYVIDKNFVKLLSNNPNNIYIFCNADIYVSHFNLDGFHTGMFISEVGEGAFFGFDVTQETIDESNYGFSKLMRKYITRPCSVIHRNVKKHYSVMGILNPISDYNSNRLYYKESLYLK